MRQISRHLKEFLVARRRNLRTDQGDEDRQRKHHHNGVNADDQRVPQDRPELVRVEKGGEVFKADPFAAEDAQTGLVILKGDSYAVHGNVREHNQ